MYMTSPDEAAVNVLTVLTGCWLTQGRTTAQLLENSCNYLVSLIMVAYLIGLIVV